MRVDFGRQQFRSDLEQQHLRLIRVVRTFAAAVVLAGIGALIITTVPAQDGRWIEAMTWSGAANSHARSGATIDERAQSQPTLDPALSVVDGVVQHG
ncbi:MAG: hypothetical protein ABJA83_07500 [Burkholderiaceae bacterium]